MENKTINIQIKTLFGELIFEYESENNSIKETLLEAIKSGADLSGADLSGADLSDADLIDADLRRANLSDADLSGADLSGADLSGADLRRADLRRADLIDADLSGANLRGADLSGAENIETAYLPIFCKWTPSIIGNKIKIGCKEKTIEEWDYFFSSNETFETSRDTEQFKQIEAVYLAYKAYYLHLNKKQS